MDDRDKFPCVMTDWEVQNSISFAIGQMPRHLVQEWAGKDRLKRRAAQERMADIIAERFKGHQVRRPAPLKPHDASATR